MREEDGMCIQQKLYFMEEGLRPVLQQEPEHGTDLEDAFKP